MKYGPISAAISAMTKAIANPSSVVCTVSPFEHVPARWRSRLDAVPSPGCCAEISRNSTIYRANCGEVTSTSRDEFTRTPSPACGQPFEAAQDKGRPPFRILGVIEPQIRQATQQGPDRDLRL